MKLGWLRDISSCCSLRGKFSIGLGNFVGIYLRRFLSDCVSRCHSYLRILHQELLRPILSLATPWRRPSLRSILWIRASASSRHQFWLASSCWWSRVPLRNLFRRLLPPELPGPCSSLHYLQSVNLTGRDSSRLRLSWSFQEERSWPSRTKTEAPPQWRSPTAFEHQGEFFQRHFSRLDSDERRQEWRI